MDAKTKNLLKKLADKYEVASFVEGDPSCILRRYKNQSDIEIASFIMALLSFGQREQFLKKANIIWGMCAACSDSPAKWIKSGGWQKEFPSGEKKFYRFYSYDEMRLLFSKLQDVLLNHDTLGEATKAAYERAKSDKSVFAAGDSGGKKKSAAAAKERVDLACVLGDMFSGCSIVPQTKTSANKRVNMFLRWMVRTGSPVDLGLWRWFSPSDLIIPLDTHVLQVAKSLGLLPEKATGSAKTAVMLTDTLREVFPDDPVRGDFALFGVGVDSDGGI